MALIETLFSEYPDGSPADWTDFWGTGDFTAVVEANAGNTDFGTKWLKWEGNVTDRSVLTWDDLGSMSDVCVVAKIRSITTSTNGIRFYLRVGGTAGNEDSYHLELGANLFRINKYVNGAATILTSENFVTLTNSEYWVKFQVIGTALKAKVWNADNLEPYDWTLEITDSDQASGAVGIGSYETGQDFYLDYIGVDSSEINMPVAYEDDVRFSSTKMPSTSYTYVNFARAMGGYFDAQSRKLKGAGVYCYTGHNDQVRIGIYSGGALNTGPQGATLLKDFGLTSGSALDQWIDILTEDDIDVPEDVPIWIVVKGDNSSGFEFKYTALKPCHGSFQVARGRCDVEAIIGKDPDVAFASTFPAGAANFSDSWYALRILTEEAPAETTSLIDLITEISTEFAPVFSNLNTEVAANAQQILDLNTEIAADLQSYFEDLSTEIVAKAQSLSDLLTEIAAEFLPAFYDLSTETSAKAQILSDLNTEIAASEITPSITDLLTEIEAVYPIRSRYLLLRYDHMPGRNEQNVPISRAIKLRVYNPDSAFGIDITTFKMRLNSGAWYVYGNSRFTFTKVNYREYLIYFNPQNYNYDSKVDVEVYCEDHLNNKGIELEIL